MTLGTHNDSREQALTAAALLPPAAVEESAWDILLMLHADRRCELSLKKLAHLASVTEPVLNKWLAALERQQLITGATNSLTGEVRAILTQSGRQLLDNYLATTGDLQLRVQQ